MNEHIETVGDALPKEIARCRELLKEYEAIGPSGRFGHMMITNDIVAAECAQASGDTIGMIQSLHKLRGCK